MMKSALILAVLALTGLQIARAADVTGKVTLKGTPPAPIPVDYTEHPECGALHPDITTTRWYLTGKDNGLKDVFVYISKGCEGKTFPVPATPVELEQQNCNYQPYVIGLMVGQKLDIKDMDEPPVVHNIHDVPVVDGNEEFNLMQIEKGQINTKVFNKKEILVKFECNVHEWMHAYVGVVDNPYFAVTDADGNFKIPNLPPGDYTLTAYHVKAHGTTPGVSQEIKVTGDAPVTAKFTVEVPK